MYGLHRNLREGVAWQSVALCIGEMKVKKFYLVKEAEIGIFEKRFKGVPFSREVYHKGAIFAVGLVKNLEGRERKHTVLFGCRLNQC